MCEKSWAGFSIPELMHRFPCARLKNSVRFNEWLSLSEVREREGSHMMLTSMRDDIAQVNPPGSVTAAQGEPDSNHTPYFGLNPFSW